MNVLSRKLAIWELEDAYWRNWMGDAIGARIAVIRLANKIIKEDTKGGKGQQETPRYQQTEEEEGDEFLIR